MGNRLLHHPAPLRRFVVVKRQHHVLEFVIERPGVSRVGHVAAVAADGWAPWLGDYRAWLARLAKADATDRRAVATSAVHLSQATLDLTKNADPTRVKSAQLAVEQAQLNLAIRKRQIAWDLQTAREGLKSAENTRAKVVSPGEYDIKSLTEAANAADAQASAAEASAEAAATQARRLIEAGLS